MTSLPAGPKVRRFLELVLQAGLPALLIGPTGVSKTAMVRALAESVGIECIILNLSTLDPTDLTGVPVVLNGVTDYPPPAFLPRSGRGILFIDEINRARQEMLNPLLQLITLRRLNRYVLPEGWLIVAAMNPDDDQGYHCEELDPALAARFVRVNVRPEVAGWLEWAQAPPSDPQDPHRPIHPAVLGFVQNTPKVFDGKFSSPRAWTWTSDLVKTAERTGTDPTTLTAAVQGLVGATFAKAFISALKSGPRAFPPKPDLIVTGYGKARPRVLALVQAGDSSAINSMCTGVITLLQDPDLEHKARNNRRIMKNLGDFTKDLPAEFRKQMHRRFPWIVSKGA